MMFRDQVLIALAASDACLAQRVEILVQRANELTDEACKQWGHAFQRSGEIIIQPPEYCARCGKSGAVVSEEHAVERGLALLARNSNGDINNCALANGHEEVECQMCLNVCPDRERLKHKRLK